MQQTLDGVSARLDNRGTSDAEESMDPSERHDPAPTRAKPVDASPGLSGEQFELLRPYGRVRAVREGEILFVAGDADYDFYVVLEGLVAVVDEPRAQPPFRPTPAELASSLGLGGGAPEPNRTTL
jgi:hypothetical protein